MKMADTNKLVQGKRYRMTVVDNVEWENLKPVEILKTYEGQFRGWCPIDPDDEELFIVFWVDGESKGWDFHPGDVKEFEKIQ